MIIIEQLRRNLLMLRQVLILIPKFKAGALLRISKYKNIFARGYTANWSKRFLRLKMLKTTASLEIEDLYGG